jgi:hypothetical protein
MARISRRGAALLGRRRIEHDSPETLLFLAAVAVALLGPAVGPFDGWVVYAAAAIALFGVAMGRRCREPQP